MKRLFLLVALLGAVNCFGQTYEDIWTHNSRRGWRKAPNPSRSGMFLTGGWISDESTKPAVKPSRVVWLTTQPKQPDESKNSLAFELKNSGSAWAQYALGMRYLNGNGVEKNEAIAKVWLKAAADNGDARAKKQLQ